MRQERCVSVDDKERCPDNGRGAVRLAIVPDLVAHAGSKHEDPSVLRLCLQFAFNTKQDVPLHAPVVGDIARGILYEPHANAAEIPGTPYGVAGVALVLSRFDFAPVGDPKRNGCDLHCETHFLGNIFLKYRAIIAVNFCCAIALPQGIEQVPHGVMVEFIHEGEQPAKFAARKSFPCKPSEIVPRQVGKQSALVFSVGHFQRHEALQEFRIHGEVRVRDGA
jgi:hypothetical protein